MAYDFIMEYSSMFTYNVVGKCTEGFKSILLFYRIISYRERVDTFRELRELSFSKKKNP